MHLERNEERTKPQEFADRLQRELAKAHPDAEERQRSLQELVGDLEWFEALRSDDLSRERAVQTESGNARYQRMATEYGMELSRAELQEFIRLLKQTQVVA